VEISRLSKEVLPPRLAACGHARNRDLAKITVTAVVAMGLVNALIHGLSVLL